MEKENALQKRKANLFNEIYKETNQACLSCIFKNNTKNVVPCRRGVWCENKSNWQTAILSLDKKENWPCAFEK